MPNFDKTGPRGQGPRTGRGLGFCNPRVVWDDFDRLEKRMQNVFKDPFFDDFNTARFPKIDIIEEDDNYIIYAALPGFKKEDIEIEYYDNRVVINGNSEDKAEVEDKKGRKVLVKEIARRNFSRAIPLETTCDFSKIKAKFNKGELRIEIPKIKEKQIKTNKVLIE